MCECVCYCAYFYYVNKLYVHVCVLERAKHSFLALPNPLSCSVMSKICLNQDGPLYNPIDITKISKVIQIMWMYDPATKDYIMDYLHKLYNHVTDACVRPLQLIARVCILQYCAWKDIHKLHCLQNSSFI